MKKYKTLVIKITACVIILITGIIFNSCVSKKPSDIQLQDKDIQFAILTENGYEFKIDTLKFKNEISSSIFSTDSNIQFDKVSIVKQLTIGEQKNNFYYLMLTDYDKKVRTCRWLVLRDDSLYLKQLATKDSENFQLIYLSCVGIQNCSPNVYNLDGKNVWLCGDNPSCLAEGQTRMGCDIYTTFIAP